MTVSTMGLSTNLSSIRLKAPSMLYMFDRKCLLSYGYRY